MEPLLRAAGLTRRFDKFVAVDHLNLSVHPGEIVGLLGPNGAGKTTSLKMLAGVMAPSEGTIRVGDIDLVADPTGAKQLLGYLPQEPYAYEKLTAREFLHFIAEIRGIPVANRQVLCDRWFEHFELTANGDQLLESFSGGMIKKVVLIATFFHDPPVLLLDEPTIELDPLTVRKVRNHLLERAAAGRAILLSTHVLEIAERLCDRIAIIYNGTIHVEGTLADLKTAWLPGGQGTLEDIFLRVTGVEVDAEELARQAAREPVDAPAGPFEP